VTGKDYVIPTETAQFTDVACVVWCRQTIWVQLQ